MSALRGIVPHLVLGALLVAGSPSGAMAQTQPLGLPSVPTTRVLAIGKATSRWSPDALRRVMPDEVRATVRLALEGKIDQWFVRKDRPGVVFVLNVSTIAEAEAVLATLPLDREKLMEFELVPLGPLAPLALLLDKPVP